MQSIVIKKCSVSDRRFDLEDGAGVDAVHSNIKYAYAVCELHTDGPLKGSGLAFTLAGGNDLVCKAIEYLSEPLVGREIEELMADFGTVYRKMSESPMYRWLGPHKGVVQLALAAIVNSCFDLWAKSRQVPLWKLLIDLTPEQTLALLDLRYLEDVLSYAEALDILKKGAETKATRMPILQTGYTGYDTSIGWFSYSDEKVVANIKKAMDAGFTAMKLKVGAVNPDHDIRRAYLVRHTAGDAATIMLDSNQQWTLHESISICQKLIDMNPYWVEEPTDPDDILAHQTLARAIYPMKVALGEHVPNKIMFKNFLQAGAMSFNQVDAVRVGGISEFITISLMSKKFGVPVLPHVGDMGQIHQHLVLYNHIAMGHEALFLEHIPHLKKYFVNPVIIEGGKYIVSQVPGSSSDLISL